MGHRSYETLKGDCPRTYFPFLTETFVPLLTETLKQQRNTLTLLYFQSSNQQTCDLDTLW